MQQIRDYIEQYYFLYHRSPSTTQIDEAVHISRSTAYKYLVSMHQNNMIHYEDGKAYTDTMEKYHSENNIAPVLGRIICGSPDEQAEYIEEYVSLPQSLFGKGEFFILRAYGDSMTGAGISDGDLVVIRRQNFAQEGEIVAALVDHSANTLKRMYLDHSTRNVILHPENPASPDQTYDTIEIQGVAVHVIKQLL